MAVPTAFCKTYFAKSMVVRPAGPPFWEKEKFASRLRTFYKPAEKKNYWWRFWETPERKTGNRKTFRDWETPKWKTGNYKTPRKKKTLNPNLGNRDSSGNLY